MAIERDWRWSDPDGKQRSVSLDELRVALEYGILPINTLVWRKEFADWQPATEVPELRGAVLAGARVAAPKESVPPGAFVALAGGAAASASEPPSPLPYEPVVRAPARPEAPALMFRDLAASLVPTGMGALGVAPHKSGPANTLIIHAGAPQGDKNSANSAPPAPIVVPSPDRGTPSNTITRPPPVDLGAMVASLPPPAATPKPATMTAVATPKPPVVRPIAGHAGASANTKVPPRAAPGVAALPVIEALSSSALESTTDLGAEWSSRDLSPAPETPRVDVPHKSSRPAAGAPIADSASMRARQSTLVGFSPADAEEVARANRAGGAADEPDQLAVTANNPVHHATTSEVQAVAKPMTAAESFAIEPAFAPNRHSGPFSNTIRAGSSSDIDAAWNDVPVQAKVPDVNAARVVPPEPLSVGRIIVESTMLLPGADSSAQLPRLIEGGPLSTDELSTDDLMPASQHSIEASLAGSKAPPAPKAGAVRDRLPSAPAGAVANAAPMRGVAPPKRDLPSDARSAEPKVVVHAPPPIPATPTIAVTASSTPPTTTSGLPPMRPMLPSRPPPPDIDPLSLAPVAPPHGDSDTQPGAHRKRVTTVSDSLAPLAPDGKRSIPVPIFVGGLLAIGGAAFFFGSRTNDPVSNPANTAGNTTTQQAITPGSVAGTSGAAIVAPPTKPTASGAPTTIEAVTKGACSIVASPRIVATDSVQVGVEISAAQAGNTSSFLVGYASGARQATAIRLDPASLVAESTQSMRTAADVQRVVPVMEGAQVLPRPELNVPIKGVASRRSLGASGLALGFERNGLALFASDKAAGVKLFAVGTPAPDRLRIAPSLGGLAPTYAFRQGASIWAGIAEENAKPVHFAGLGDEIGSPGVARVGSRVLSFWADRASKDQPWALRTANFDAGMPAEVAPTAFVPPPSLGGGRFSPVVVPFGADRALLLWTEEGTRNGESAHEVRGVVINASTAMEGAPFAVSLPNQNAGQPHAALLPDGSGVVGYLVLTPDHYEVAVAGIRCQ